MNTNHSLPPASSAAETTPPPPEGTPTIRLIPHITDMHRGLNFPIIERKLNNGKLLRVKRFVEKGNVDMSDCIAFKSKVVSRQHGEIWTQGMNFFYRDTKSSSGTFINNVRISPANTESSEYQLKDGDIIQLGVDYQGRSEDIFRCVRMRVELNREAFKHRNNSFRNQVIKALRALAAASDVDSTGTGDCCICLGSIAPFQALFIAPCCHSFHYKCVRPLLHTWPNFSCPLCRHFADLSASVSIDDLAMLAIDDVQPDTCPPAPIPPSSPPLPCTSPDLVPSSSVFHPASTPVPIDPTFNSTPPLLQLPELSPPLIGSNSFIFMDAVSTQALTGPSTPLTSPSQLPSHPSVAVPNDNTPISANSHASVISAGTDTNGMAGSGPNLSASASDLNEMDGPETTTPLAAESVADTDESGRPKVPVPPSEAAPGFRLG